MAHFLQIRMLQAFHGPLKPDLFYPGAEAQAPDLGLVSWTTLGPTIPCAVGGVRHWKLGMRHVMMSCQVKGRRFAPTTYIGEELCVMRADRP